MSWVLDASVAVRWFLEDESNENAERVLDRLVQQPGRFAVPELFCFEIFSVLQRLHPAPLKAFVEGVMPILQGGLLRYPMTESLAGRADKFERKGLSAYDACYVALAEELEGVWLTFDKRAVSRPADPKLAYFLDRGLPKEWDD
jgi:predicted nucleic acid-binding protein